MQTGLPLTAIACLLLLFSATSVAAPMGADLVVVIDQSGSMSATDAAAGLPASDPHGMRVSFLENLVSKLLQGADKGYTNRLSVIEFGGRNARTPSYRPQITLSGAIFEPTHAARSLAQVRREILGAIATIRPAKRGDTDHAAALGLAAQELERLRANPPPPSAGSRSGKRVQVVVLVTDGKPSAGGVSHRAMLEQTRSAVADFPEGASFVVFGLDDGSHFWTAQGPVRGTTWEKFWRGLATPDENGAGRAYGAKNPGELVEKLSSLLLSLLPPPVERITEDFHRMPPYLKAVDFTMTFEQPRVPDSAIEVRGPDGQRVGIPADAQRWANGISFRVPHPQPGRWITRPAGAPYRVSISYEYEDAHLLEPSGTLRQHSSTPIRYRLSGRGPAGLFRPEPGFPALRFSATVISPSGSREVFPLHPDTTQPGMIVSDRPLSPAEFGAYRIELVGTALGPGSTTGSRPVYVATDERQVTQATPVRFRVEAPADGETQILFLGRGEIALWGAFVSSIDGSVLAPDRVLAPGQTLTAKVLIPGMDDQESVPLQAESAALAAEVPVRLGEGRWRLLFNPANLTLYLDGGPSPFRPDIHFDGVEGGGEWVTAGYPVRESGWTLVLAITAIVLLAAALYFLWPLVLLPYIIGRQDRQQRRHPRLLLKFPTEPGLNRQWDLTGRPTLRPSSRLVQLPGGEEWTIEGFAIHRRLSAPEVLEAKVSYRPRTISANDEETRKRIRTDLRATRDEPGDSQATHKIQGLGQGMDAYFVVLPGRAEATDW